MKQHAPHFRQNNSFFTDYLMEIEDPWNLQKKREKVSLREFLRAHYPHTSCLGFAKASRKNATMDPGEAFGGNEIKVEEFLQWLKTSPYNSAGICGLNYLAQHPNERNEEQFNDLSGFVTISGGITSPPDPRFGYCHMKKTVTSSNLGVFSLMQMKLATEENIRRYKQFEQQLLQEPLTLSRMNFGPDEHFEVLSIDYLKFLIRNFKLHQFKIHHIYLFRCKMYLTPLISSLLKQRAYLKKTGGSSLMQLSLKLVVSKNKTNMKK